MYKEFYPTVSSSRVETLNQFLPHSNAVSQLSAKVLSGEDREIASRFDIGLAIQNAEQQRIDA